MVKPDAGTEVSGNVRYIAGNNVVVVELTTIMYSVLFIRLALTVKLVIAVHPLKACYASV